MSLTNFWKILSKDRSKISKMYKLMKKSIKDINYVQSIWKKNEESFNLDLKAKKTYGFFLRNMLMEESKGKEMIETANKQILRRMKERFEVGNMYYKEDLSVVSTPICILSLNINGKIIIYNCNNSFSRVLGYAKSSIVKEKLKNYVLPSCYGFYKKLFKNMGINNSNNSYDRYSFIFF